MVGIASWAADVLEEVQGSFVQPLLAARFQTVTSVTPLCGGLWSWWRADVRTKTLIQVLQISDVLNLHFFVLKKPSKLGVVLMLLPEMYFFTGIYELVFCFLLVKRNVSLVVKGVAACNEAKMLNYMSCFTF